MGTKAEKVHVPSDLIALYDEGWGAALVGDKANSVIFDNTKLKSLVPSYKPKIPFSRGAQEIIAWLEENPSHKKVNPEANALQDKLIEKIRSIRL